jgi:hypothetical protein
VEKKTCKIMGHNNTHRVAGELEEEDGVLEQESPQGVVLLGRGARLPAVQEGAEEVEQQPQRGDGGR